jgi:hypothetical protein
VRFYVDGRERGADDGYRCELVPGLRSSHDARRLLEEVSFAAGRLHALAAAPAGVYAAAVALAGEGDLEQASWLCFLAAYLSPLDGETPFIGIAGAPSLDQTDDLRDEAIEALPLGPRTCHRQGRGASTLRAYLSWAQRAGSQQRALGGDSSWSAERRFERVFERLAIPGFPRWGRYELLVSLGGLRLYELRADSLHLAAAAATPRAADSGLSPRGDAASGSDPVLAAAKRIFGIGDPLLLERRSSRLAEELGAPLEALELGFFNWFSPQRATLGFAEAPAEQRVLSQGPPALGL